MPSGDVHVSAQGYLIKALEVLSLNLPYGMVSESDSMESER